MTLSAAIEAALRLHVGSSPREVHSLQIRLARLLLQHGPPAVAEQLRLAEAFLLGEVSAAELRGAEQDLWTYVGSLACGCSVADSASGAAFLVCLAAETSSHTPAALAEQAERALRAGAPEQAVLAVLARGI